jgi:hypothetical protein
MTGRLLRERSMVIVLLRRGSAAGAAGDYPTRVLNQF